MSYNSNNPPVIKTNLGSDPWPDIVTTRPHCTLYDASGVALTLDLDTDTEMTDVSNTPMWIYEVGTHMTVVDADLEIFYVITRGVGGETVDEGSVRILSTTSLLGVADEVEYAEVNVPAAVEIPTSGGVSKTFKFTCIPRKKDGSVASVDGITVAVDYADAGNADISATALTNLGNDTWEYEWTITDQLVADVATVTFITTKSAVNKTLPTRNVQLFKRDQFNPQLIAQGNVIV